MHYRVFWLPKEGNTAEEYEDAYAGDPASGCFAIADGASESSYAALWARLLVQGFVREPACQPDDWRTWLSPLQQDWNEEVGDRPRPWNVEAKIQIGAFATFLGVVVPAEADEDGEHRWHAIAVGDSCLFQRRAGQVRRVFPPMRSFADFHNRPALVGVRTSPATAPAQLQTRQSRWRTGDQLWLMTDALAQWFLRQSEEGNNPGEAIDALLEDPAEDRFQSWVEDRWAREALRVDDVTLLAIQL